MDEAATNGVRSGITSLGSEDVQNHSTGGEVTPRAVRMSLRPPARFTEKTDFALWIRRFERYVVEAKIPEEKRTGELFPLLEDEPFRVVVQQGLVDSIPTTTKSYSACVGSMTQKVMNWSFTAGFNSGCSRLVRN